ncbi:MAG TPA: alkaline phosphatase PafA [Flavisolibacter sp.]|nr:alkaline phosphatase PafA [Flavisolibacter sp.]
MKRLTGFLLLLVVFSAQAQNVNRPKLVVGMVVDQMRWDYLYRYYDRYTNDGFKRLLREGFSCENTFIPYLPTHTAPGHTCVYTGSVPALHGIMGNNWYDEAQKKTVYCTDDSTVQTVGSTSVAGKMSPRNMWANTVTDELRLATNFQSKTIAIALKDRGAILPGGHMANAAYWFDNATGGWISSTFYMQDLPAWVKKFNNRKLPDTYLSQNWNTLFPIETYKQSTADSNAYEGKLGTEDFTFPHTTASITSNKYESFRTTPSGNTYTFEMAKAALEAEQLGKRGVTDFLALSFSSPDYIGHTFGPNSIEVEDTYLRLDRELAGFLKHLDATIGKGQYLVFLTADHGAAHNATFLRDNKISVGSFDEAKVRRELNDSLQKYFGSKNLIGRYTNYQYFLDDSVVAQNNINRKKLKEYIICVLAKQPAEYTAVDIADISASSLPVDLKVVLSNSFNAKLSGDIQVIFKPSGIDSWRVGATHGLWNPYDSHIPLLWFGWKIKPGKSHREVYMTDIAPTVSALLHIQMPNATIGNVIEEVIRTGGETGK